MAAVSAGVSSAVNENPDLEFKRGITKVSVFPLKAFCHNLRPDWQSAYVVFECNLLRFLQKQSQSAMVVGDVSKDIWQSLGGPGVHFNNNAWPTRNVQPG